MSTVLTLRNCNNYTDQWFQNRSEVPRWHLGLHLLVCIGIFFYDSDKNHRLIINKSKSISENNLKNLVLLITPHQSVPLHTGSGLSSLNYTVAVVLLVMLGQRRCKKNHRYKYTNEYIVHKCIWIRTWRDVQSEKSFFYHCCGQQQGQERLWTSWTWDTYF